MKRDYYFNDSGEETRRKEAKKIERKLVGERESERKREVRSVWYTDIGTVTIENERKRDRDRVRYLAWHLETFFKLILNPNACKFHNNILTCKGK